MKSISFRKLFLLLIAAIGCLLPLRAPAHLPKPSQADGIILAIDQETHTLIFKPGKGKRPLILDWNRDTEFIKDGRPAEVTELKVETRVHVYYRDVSFHSPLLKKVTWISDQQPHQGVATR